MISSFHRHFSTALRLGGFLAVGATLSGAAAQTVYSSGTNSITTDTTISTYTALAGPVDTPPVLNLGADVTLTVGDGSSTAFLLVGFNGEPTYGRAGIFNQTGGTISVVGVEGAVFPGSAVAIGDSGGVGTFNLSGGTLDLKTNSGSNKITNLAVGTTGGTGTLAQSGGAVMIGTNFSIGTGSASSNGMYTMTGGTLTGFGVGEGSSFIYLGDEGGTGTWNIGGTANVDLASTTTVYVGGDENGVSGNTGAIVQSGGTATFDGNLILGRLAGSTGTYDLDGGTLEIGGNRLLAGDGTASLKLGGGTLKVTGTNLGTAVVTELKAGTSSKIDADGLDAIFDSGVNGSGDLEKVGTGRLIVNGVSSVGSLVVTEGIVSFSNTVATQSVTVTNAAFLDLRASDNTADGNVTVEDGGMLIGEISADGAMLIEEGGTQALGTFSQDSSGTYSLEGTLTLDLSVSPSAARIAANQISLGVEAEIIMNTSGALPLMGSTFSLFSGSLTGWENVELTGAGALAGYEFSLGANGVLTVTAVPEPSVVMLMGLGVGVLCFMVRRRCVA